MKSMTAFLSRYWLWQFYLQFFFMIQNTFWGMPLCRLCTNFWRNSLICFCNAVLSRRIRSSLLPQRLCTILSVCRVFIFSIMSDGKYLNGRLFQNTYFSETYINIKIIQWRIYFFLHAFGFCLSKTKRISLGICLSKSIFSPAYEMTGYTKCPNINFCGMSVYSSVNLQWIFWFSISLSQTAGKLNFSNRHQFTVLNACSALQDVLIIFFSAKWQIPFSWQ